MASEKKIQHEETSVSNDHQTEEIEKVDGEHEKEKESDVSVQKCDVCNEQLKPNTPIYIDIADKHHPLFTCADCACSEDEDVYRVTRCCDAPVKDDDVHGKTLRERKIQCGKRGRECTYADCRSVGCCYGVTDCLMLDGEKSQWIPVCLPCYAIISTKSPLYRLESSNTEKDDRYGPRCAFCTALCPDDTILAVHVKPKTKREAMHLSRGESFVSVCLECVKKQHIEDLYFVEECVKTKTTAEDNGDQQHVPGTSEPRLLFACTLCWKNETSYMRVVDDVDVWRFSPTCFDCFSRIHGPCSANVLYDATVMWAVCVKRDESSEKKRLSSLPTERRPTKKMKRLERKADTEEMLVREEKKAALLGEAEKRWKQSVEERKKSDKQDKKIPE